MGQDGAGIDQIKLGIEYRGRLEQDRTGADSRRGLERIGSNKTGYKAEQVRKQEPARQVQDEVSERYKVE
ncbi:hypothetical protein XELAEV_18001122mg [Xenopus laevis]|nr:hypothetical protein XELAEV_18001122mg [Xenopus laevis]